MAKPKQPPSRTGGRKHFIPAVLLRLFGLPTNGHRRSTPKRLQPATVDLTPSLAALDEAMTNGADPDAIHTAFTALSNAERQAHWHTGETLSRADQIATWEQSIEAILLPYRTDPALSDGLTFLGRLLRQIPNQPLDAVTVSAQVIYRTFIEEGNGDVIRFAQQVATTNSREEISANEDLIVSLARMFGQQTATRVMPYIYRLKEAEAEHEQECPTFFGIDHQTGTEVFLSEKTRSQLVTVSGAMGVGKSIFLASLIEQDIQQGRGVIVTDPHGPLVRQIVARMPEERLDDVIILDLASENAVGLNLFACPQPRTMHTIAATAHSISHVLEKVFGTSMDRTPRLLGVLRATTRLLIDNDLTLAEIPLLLSNNALRAKMVANCTNSSIVSFWEGYNRRSQRDKDDLVASCLNKIMSFLDHDLLRLIVSQSKTTLEMRRILDEGKILLVSLSPQYQEAGTLIGATLISQLLSAMYARGPYPENDYRACALYCDEYASYATEDFVALCTEARKFRILNTLAFQVLETLDDANRATALQAGTLCVFRVSGDDSKVYARSFDSTPPTQEQTGWEPVRAVPTDVISHLLRHGSLDPAVSNFAQKYLFNLDTYLKKPRSSNSRFYDAFYDNFDGAISLTEATVHLGHKYLNDSLYQCMTDQNPKIHIAPIALFCLAMAQGDGREYSFSRYIISQRGPSTNRMLKSFKEPANRLGTPSFLKPQEQAFFLEQCPKPRKYRRTAEAVTQMIIDLRHCIAALAENPLLVDSGQYKPVYRQRGFHDVEAEIANLIKTQDNYVARVKVLTSEHTIRTAPPPPLLPGEQIDERILYIKNNMLNLGLCKPAHEVDEEIRLRHEKLLAPTQNDSPPPTRTNRRRFRQRPPTDA